MDQPKTWLQDALIPPEPDGHFVMIPLTQGKFAIVDEADAELVLSAGSWFAAKHQRSRTWYAMRTTLYMHVHITGMKGLDHANQNGLDNRRINLREATPSQQQANRGMQPNNTSGYKGVYWNRKERKWGARIEINYRAVRLGSFADPLDAARAYNRAALEAWGEFAWLNPVPIGPVLPAGHARRKLTSGIVRECRERHAAGETFASLACEFDTGLTTMWKAISGETWKHVA